MCQKLYLVKRKGKLFNLFLSKGKVRSIDQFWICLLSVVLICSRTAKTNETNKKESHFLNWIKITNNCSESFDRSCLFITSSVSLLDALLEYNGVDRLVLVSRVREVIWGTVPIVLLHLPHSLLNVPLSVELSEALRGESIWPAGEQNHYFHVFIWDSGPPPTHRHPYFGTKS